MIVSQNPYAPMAQRPANKAASHRTNLTMGAHLTGDRTQLDKDLARIDKKVIDGFMSGLVGTVEMSEDLKLKDGAERIFCLTVAPFAAIGGAISGALEGLFNIDD